MNNKTNKLIPELRFPEFVNDGEWSEEELGNCLDYLQPTNYIVRTTAYEDNYKTPVLTAGKTFILGYTNEEDGVFSKKLPVIIFDDFTTASKYVDFPFKVKSSAMKILLAKKSNNIKFIFESMQMIKLEVGVHGRHWISVYSILKIPFPSPKEQQKIANCLSSLDELLTAQNDKLETLKNHKRGLMQNLFPQKGEKVPKFRFKEFEKDGDWKEKSFDKLLEIGNGRDYKHLNKGEVPVYGTGGYMLSVDDYLYDGESACIGRKGTIDKPMFLEGKFWTVDTLFYTHSFNNCLPKFIFYIFQTIDWKKHNEAGGVPSLSKANIYKIEIFVPEPKEQDKITNFLSSLDILINKQERKIEQLKLHKIGLMQGLFPKLIN